MKFNTQGVQITSASRGLDGWPIARIGLIWSSRGQPCLPNVRWSLVGRLGHRSGSPERKEEKKARGVVGAPPSVLTPVLSGIRNGRDGTRSRKSLIPHHPGRLLLKGRRDMAHRGLCERFGKRSGIGGIGESALVRKLRPYNSLMNRQLVDAVGFRLILLKARPDDPPRSS